MPGRTQGRGPWMILLILAVSGYTQPTAKLGADQPAAAALPAPPVYIAPALTPTLRAEPQAEAPLPAALGPNLAPPPAPDAAPMLRQLTQGGCCTKPFWSPDARQVLFIDRPAADEPVGTWGVDVMASAAKSQLVTGRIALYSRDMAFVIEPDRDTTTIEQLTAPLTGTTAARWTVPVGGHQVEISPGHVRIAWTAGNDALLPEPERQVNQIWVANLDGSSARSIMTLPRGGVSGWISDDVLLLSGRESLQAREQVYWAFSLTTGQKIELARGERLRGGLLSPDGAWLAYLVTLDKDQSNNGLWVIRTDGSARRRLDPSLFGAFQWRDDHRLLVIPFQPDAASHDLMEFDVNTGQVGRLTDPNETPLKIANGDWAVSPDGRYLVFLGSQDHNLWLLTLPN